MQRILIGSFLVISSVLIFLVFYESFFSSPLSVPDASVVRLINDNAEVHSSHQSRQGGSLPPSRIEALLDWASEKGRNSYATKLPSTSFIPSSSSSSSSSSSPPPPLSSASLKPSTFALPTDEAHPDLCVDRPRFASRCASFLSDHACKENFMHWGCPRTCSNCTIRIDGGKRVPWAEPRRTLTAPTTALQQSLQGEMQTGQFLEGAAERKPSTMNWATADERDLKAFSYHVFVSEKYKFVMWTIPKVSCTEFIRLFRRLNGDRQW